MSRGKDALKISTHEQTSAPSVFTCERPPIPKASLEDHPKNKQNMQSLGVQQLKATRRTSFRIEGDTCESGPPRCPVKRLGKKSVKVSAGPRRCCTRKTLRDNSSIVAANIPQQNEKPAQVVRKLAKLNHCGYAVPLRILLLRSRPISATTLSTARASTL